MWMTMSYDGLFTHAMVQELQAKLVEGRVMKISQPYPNEVILTIRSQRKNYPLLLSANPSYARAQITAIPYTNPPVPTNFTMMLRKYLEGARLVAIEQLECDRVINFAFSNRNELGDKLPLLLSIEIMGRHSNVILINQAENKIIDTIKHVGLDQNRYRTLLPGSTYRLPPKQAKQNPLTASPADFEQLVAAYPNREVLAKELQANFQGLALDSALYLADYFHQTGVSAASLAALWAKLAQPTPSLLTEPKLNFSAFDYPSATASTSTPARAAAARSAAKRGSVSPLGRKRRGPFIWMTKHTAASYPAERAAASSSRCFTPRRVGASGKRATPSSSRVTPLISQKPRRSGPSSQ